MKKNLVLGCIIVVLNSMGLFALTQQPRAVGVLVGDRAGTNILASVSGYWPSVDIHVITDASMIYLAPTLPETYQVCAGVVQAGGINRCWSLKELRARVIKK